MSNYKVAEEFVVKDFSDPFFWAFSIWGQPRVLNKYGANYYAAPVLCSMGSDGNSSTVITVLFDYRKNFDSIDNGMELSKLNIRRSIINSIIDFQSNRS